MGVILGIDIGGSSTKIVGLHENGTVIDMLRVKAEDPLTSLYGALGNFLATHSLKLTDIGHIALTGVGASYVDGDIYGVRTVKVEEFPSVGVGGLALSRKERAVVVSMGTGTSFVKVEGQQIRHIGGLGVGGGTLLGLSRLLLKTQDIHLIAEMAQKGTLTNIDLQIQDICNRPLPDLPLDATASNFGKADGNASPEDIASGIIHMVLQSIGQAAFLASLNSSIKDFVLIGNLTQLPQCKEVFPKMEKMYGVRFLIPKYSEYRTAIGAALTYINRSTIYPVK